MSRSPRAEQLCLAIGAAPSAMAVLLPDLTHAALSPLWADLHGREAESLAGCRYDLVFPEAARAWADVRAAAFDGVVGETRPVCVPGAEARHVRYAVRAWSADPAEPAQMLVVHAQDASAEVLAATGASRQRSLVEAVTRHAPMVVFAFDGDGALTLRSGRGLDPRAAGVWGGADLHGAPAVAAGIRTVLAGEPAAWSAETAGRTYDVSAAPTHEPDGSVGGGVGVAVDVTERVAAERRAALQADGLRRVVSVISRPGSLATLAEALLGELAAFLGLDVGLLARTADGVYTCLAGYAGPGAARGAAMAPGDSMPIGDTYCDLALAAGGVVAIDHMGTSEFVWHRCYETLGLEAYIGAPVLVDGAPYGALSFSSTRPASRPFTDADRDLVGVAAQWAGGLIERDLLRRGAAAPGAPGTGHLV